MTMTICKACCSEMHWNWEEAFDKFGFADGDGLVMTEHVAEALRKASYTVKVEPWGLHNVVITSIKSGKQQRELIPNSVDFGCDDPRDYLPKKIVKLLDEAFSDDTEVEP